MAKVVAICVSDEKGTVKNVVPEVTVEVDHGIVGDAHAGKWHRQISLLGNESVDKIRVAMPDIAPGAFAENILTEGIELYTLPVGTKLKIGEVLIEITQIGKQCHAACAIRKLTGDCVMPREGVFAAVLTGGLLKSGDEIEIVA
ncbi:MAG: MOSC domain-containing protein [Firmicutes bacterium]|nr:MOSC domain-containing protein [Bacillota bacterium]